MKKLFYLLTIVTVGLFASCADDSDLTGGSGNTTPSEPYVSNTQLLQGATAIDIPAGVKNVRVVNWADQKEIGVVPVVDGQIWLCSPKGWTTVQLYDDDAEVTEENSGYIKDAVIKRSDDNYVTIKQATPVNFGYNSQDFLDIFPGGKNNLQKYENGYIPANTKNFTLNVLYKSDGRPFSIYPIYSLGWYDLTLGIFYYVVENGQLVTKTFDFWYMQDENIKWKRTYKDLSENNVKDFNQYEVCKNTDAEGYKIQLPAGTVFGFYVACDNDLQAGKFYSYQPLNVDGKSHAANFVGINDVNGANYIGFEDQKNISSKNSDWDLNDLICYITPELDIVDIPTPPIVPPTPDDIDDLVHYQKCNLDIEGRYDENHKYIRVSYPLYNKEKVTLHLEKFNDFCEQDDTRIVTADDKTIIYYETEKENKVGDIEVIKKDNSEGGYGTVTVVIDNNEAPGKYELKVEMYPKSEEEFAKFIEWIEGATTDICSLIESTIYDDLFWAELLDVDINDHGAIQRHVRYDKITNDMKDPTSIVSKATSNKPEGVNDSDLVFVVHDSMGSNGPTLSPVAYYAKNGVVYKFDGTTWSKDTTPEN